MGSASAIIGAAYGDEGKGLFTDYLANQMEKSLVIRYNGGANSSHTVVTDNFRHIFGHIGSGSFVGADTYLSEFFVSNPMLFKKESKELSGKIDMGDIRISTDFDGLVSTPFDMILNQLAEQGRGRNRHGSCGIGLGETVERCQYPCFRTLVRDLLSEKTMTKKLDLLFDRYVPKRLDDLDINGFYETDFYRNIDRIIEKYINDIDFFANAVDFRNISDREIRERNIIFEGAQGLALDMNYGDFPHVTRSSTGLFNVLTLCDLMEIESLDIYYVVRAYLTRHGAGDLHSEVFPWPYGDIMETTNLANEWQGEFRYGLLDLDFIRNLIHRDIRLLDRKVTLNLVVTCLDQVGDAIYLHKKQDGIKMYSRKDFFNLAKEKFPGFRIYFSEGNRRSDVKCLT